MAGTHGHDLGAQPLLGLDEAVDNAEDGEVAVVGLQGPVHVGARRQGGDLDVETLGGELGPVERGGGVVVGERRHPDPLAGHAVTRTCTVRS
ncbi:MAG: hypothetical protein M3507_10970, partial [Actinomycetota bacterium]|nr:hypothetical protein [Actinomycetota bacterium]